MNLQYKSFYWSLGTTSFRTKNFNKKIEQQLALLRNFWLLKENVGKNWNGNDEIQTAYYDFLHEVGFIYGNANNKPKDAREKTYGLVSLGLIDDNRRLTKVGEQLLSISERNDFSVDNPLGIPADSFIYLKQLLKTSVKVDTERVRPFIVTIYLITKLGGLSYEEFTYLLPLSIDRQSTLDAVENIKALRNNETFIDEIILARLMARDNYKTALQYFLKVPIVTADVIATVGINRKSRQYDKAYFPLYDALHKFYLEHKRAAVNEIVPALKRLTNTGKLWQRYIFGNNDFAKIKKNPSECLQLGNFDDADTEEKFRRAFFATMHVIKAKRSLEDYFDLNRRYMKTSDIILFSDEKVSLDIVPRYYFVPICDRLLDIAFDNSALLQENCRLEDIAAFLRPNENVILDGINHEFALKLNSLKDASEILDRQRYIRLNHLIDSKFTDEQILNLLTLISDRADDEIQKLVTDNADIPTIFEYILGILWYKISDRQGKILDYMKLSLDVDLLPKTHAAGGEADIVYEYPKSVVYPAHSLLLEATLSDRTNQRRMEMEPVSRHLGNHILRTRNLNSYCVFATNDLNINVVSDFRGRKNQRYYDTSDDNNFIEGMKIIPLQIEDLKNIVKNQLRYEKLYKIFEAAFQSELAPREWRDICIAQILVGPFVGPQQKKLPNSSEKMYRKKSLEC
ncbi:MAG: AlwI family type II restriction endonuclease [Selenomonadaceae bacterium]|nr:AlwI family type II restriction endonuclease [Selenomonadaceae bacterium]